MVTNETIEEMKIIKKQMKDREQIILFCNEKQKIKLMKLGKKVYEITFNYGDKRVEDCIIDMYLSK